jgi:hypothetical protein
VRQSEFQFRLWVYFDDVRTCRHGGGDGWISTLWIYCVPMEHFSNQGESKEKSPNETVLMTSLSYRMPACFSNASQSSRRSCIAMPPDVSHASIIIGQTMARD